MALGGALGSGLRVPWSRVTPRTLCVAGAPLGDIHFRFTWQAWQAWLNPVSTSGFAWQTRYSWLGWRAWVWFRRALVVCDAAVLCVAGVVLGNILFRFMWQAWRNFPSTSVLRGRRGWHSWHWWRAWVWFRRALVARDAADCAWKVGSALGSDLNTPWPYVTQLHCMWQAWYLVISLFVSRGMRGTVGDPEEARRRRRRRRWGGGGGDGARRPRIQNQNWEPQTKIWGIKNIG